MNELLYLIILALSSVVSLFVIAKILGKKQVAQLEFIDYVIGISIGSISAEMATDINDKPLYYYLIAMSIYFIADIIITMLGRKSPALKHFFKGSPLIIIYEGKIDYTALNKSKLDINDLLTLARSQGYFDLRDIEYAVFENNGQLSILPKAPQRPTVAKDLNIPLKQPELPIYLIIDGKISKSSLNKIHKTKQWVYKKLKIKNSKNLKNIILAIYDKDKDNISVTHKSQKF